MYKIFVFDDPEINISIFLCNSVFFVKVNNENIAAINAANIGKPYRIVEMSKAVELDTYSA